MIDLLSLDHYIDATDNENIRLRLREVGPRDISEAERIAVRLEAHRIADKDRHKQIREIKVEDDRKEEDIYKFMADIRNEMKMFKEQCQKEPGRKGYNRGYTQGQRYFRHNDWKDENRYYNNGNQSQNAGNAQQASIRAPARRH